MSEQLTYSNRQAKRVNARAEIRRLVLDKNVEEIDADLLCSLCSL